MGGHITPTSSRARRWGAFFNTGPAFSIYVGHLAKACQYWGFDSSPRIDSGASASMRGIKHDQDFSDRFDNFILKDLWIKIHKWESIDIEFGRLFYLGFIAPLRIQSEEYPALRASIEGDQLNRKAMRHPVLTGIRQVPGQQKHISKLRNRRNERKISILTRPCFCKGSPIAPAGL